MALCRWCTPGAPKLVYTGRAICKAWDACVKQLTESEFSALYSVAYGNTRLAALMGRLPAPPVTAVQINELPADADVTPAAAMFRAAVLRGGWSKMASIANGIKPRWSALPSIVYVLPEPVAP